MHPAVKLNAIRTQQDIYREMPVVTFTEAGLRSLCRSNFRDATAYTPRKLADIRTGDMGLLRSIRRAHTASIRRENLGRGV